MDQEYTNLKLLLVDDEEDFRRATTAALTRRGFTITETADGKEALAAIKHERPDIVILDLKMPGMSGIETLQEIRQIDTTLPVIILTGHGDLGAAMAGIKLDIVDFLQKPIDMDQLAGRVRNLLKQGVGKSLREQTIAELMAPPSRYPRLYIDQPVSDAIATLRETFYRPTTEGVQPRQVRSALVFDRSEKFLGFIRFVDMLKLVLPQFLEDSPYTTFFTGMFLAQIKLIGKRNIHDLMDELVYVNLHDPIMKAVHLMVHHRLINLPVMDKGELVGVLRDRDIILEVAKSMEF
ncbi:MAG: response regulator [bacterium]